MDISQIVGAVGSVVALVVAFLAIYKAKRDLTNERRITHELEVLRGLIEAFREDTDEIVKVTRCWLYLRMLPDSKDLPLMRAAVGVRPTDTARREFKQRFPKAKSLPTGGKRDKWIALDRLEHLTVDRAYEEINEAIERRVAPRRRWSAPHGPTGFAPAEDQSRARRTSTSAPGEPVKGPPGEPSADPPGEPRQVSPD